jgi:hypothetical protein
MVMTAYVKILPTRKREEPEIVLGTVGDFEKAYQILQESIPRQATRGLEW